MRKNFKYLQYASVSLAILATIVACGDDDPIINPDKPTPIVTETNKYLSRIEVPKMQDDNIFIQHSTKYGSDSVMTFCLEYDPKKFHSRWVAFRFDGTTRQKNTSRPDKDPFIDDPSLPANLAIGFNGFGKTYKDMTGIQRNMSFDRGHIVASADRLYSVEANAQTFYMTNMSPQISEFNQHFWVAFEQYVQDLGRSETFADTLYVVKGGTIDKVKNNGKSEDGTIGTITRTNGKTVVIPKYYYMAMLCLKDGNYNSMGFLIEHKEYEYNNSGKDVSKEIMKSYIVTIDELETFTGIDFFHNLPNKIEKAVESTCNPEFWKL